VLTSRYVTECTVRIGQSWWSRSTETASGADLPPPQPVGAAAPLSGGRRESMVQLSSATVTSEMAIISRSMVMCMSCQSLSNHSASSMS